MADPVTWVAIGGLAISAAGAGMSYYAAQDAAEQQEQMAKYNYAIQTQNAQMQAAVLAHQYQSQMAMASLNYQGQNAAANAMLTNAKVQEQQGAAAERRGVEEVRRQREEQARLLGRQRAGYAAAGVVMEGTPLEVLADTTRLLELQIQDTMYAADQEKAGFNWQATITRHNAALAKFGATNFLIDGAQAAYMKKVAGIGLGMELRQAEINRLAGVNQAGSTRTQANINLLSNTASLAGQAYNVL